MNGSVTAPTARSGGAIVAYGCDPGFTLNGSAEANCTDDGSWSAAPTCDANAIVCPALAAPTNGSVSALMGVPGDIRSYACDQGYTLKGAASIICQQSGAWSDMPATCAATLCLTNQYVANHACTACALGSTRSAGDDASGGDTACAATLCMTNQYLANHACTACALGSTRSAGDDATGGDTACDITPVANDISPPALAEDTAVSIALSYNDPDGPATSCIVNNLAHAVLTTPCSCSAGTCAVTVSGSPLDYSGPAQFTFTVANAQTSNVATASLTITPVNDPPENKLPGPQVATVDTTLPIGGISVNDVDANLSTAQLSVAHGTVSVNLAGGATIGGGGNGTSGLTLSGTQAQINAALVTLSYQASLGFSGSDALNLTAMDDAAATDADDLPITVVAVNVNAPVNSVPGAQVVAKNTPLSLSGISVSDPNGDLAMARVDVTNGALTVSVSGGVSISAGANGTASLTLSGSQANINATLATLVYQGILEYSGVDRLILTSIDNTALRDVGAVDLTVTP